MSSSRVFRLVGWTLAIAAGTWLVASAFSDIALGGQDPTHASSALFGPVQAIIFVAGVLTAFAMVGQYASRFASLGKLGLVGFVAIFLSVEVFGVALSAIGATFVPWLESTASGRQMLSGQNGPGALFIFFIAATVLQVIGGLCYGSATWRGKGSRVAAGLLIASGVLAIPGFLLGGPDTNIPAVIADLPGLMFIAGLAWLGVVMALDKTEEPVSAPLRTATTGRTA